MKRLTSGAFRRKGFTLIEVLIGAAVFVAIAISVYGGFKIIIDVVKTARVKTLATLIANEQFEIAKNLPYSDVGIVGGIPVGKILAAQSITRDSIPFTIAATVRSIDDPFDGSIGGTPNDLSPADYKLVEFIISCQSCGNFSPQTFTGRIAPKNLEGASTNGALFIQVFDANGQPVSGANVHIQNSQTLPPLTIDDTTGVNGMLQIVDVPPSSESYQVNVSKNGYSSAQTYVRDAGNPHPTPPYATVALQQVTSLSFAIDRVASLLVSSVTNTCTSIPSVNFNLSGTKLIGTSPDVLKYNQSKTTDGAGNLSLSSLEWDTYSLVLNSGSYDLVGTNPLIPLNLPPNTTQNLKLILAPKDPNTLLVAVKDSGTGLPISGATVELENNPYDAILTTGEGYLRQSDWSGGGGQSDFTDVTKYESDNGSVDVSQTGSMQLKGVLGAYLSPGIATSSIFDTGGASNFDQIIWQPGSEPQATGQDSLKFQIATNNDKSTWNYVGPDGTPNTFYTVSNSNINSIHNGDRYLRYKVFLSTADSNVTPTLSDVSFTFSSSCTPPGQVSFTGLSSGTYNVTVTKAGYQTYSGQTTVNGAWQKTDISISP